MTTYQGDDGSNDLAGLDVSDVIRGGDGADRLRGGDGADAISGGGGDDAIWGGEGNDAINGGTGWDVVGFKGAIGNFSFYLDSLGRLHVVDNVGNEGNDTIVNVEEYIFNNVHYLYADLPL